jgi:hypothetical protein
MYNIRSRSAPPPRPRPAAPPPPRALGARRAGAAPGPAPAVGERVQGRYSSQGSGGGGVGRVGPQGRGRGGWGLRDKGVERSGGGLGAREVPQSTGCARREGVGGLAGGDSHWRVCSGSAAGAGGGEGGAGEAGGRAARAQRVGLRRRAAGEVRQGSASAAAAGTGGGAIVVGAPSGGAKDSSWGGAGGEAGAAGGGGGGRGAGLSGAIARRRRRRRRRPRRRRARRLTCVPGAAGRPVGAQGGPLAIGQGAVRRGGFQGGMGQRGPAARPWLRAGARCEAGDVLAGGASCVLCGRAAHWGVAVSPCWGAPRGVGRQARRAATATRAPQNAGRGLARSQRKMRTGRTGVGASAGVWRPPRGPRGPLGVSQPSRGPLGSRPRRPCWVSARDGRLWRRPRRLRRTAGAA